MNFVDVPADRVRAGAGAVTLGFGGRELALRRDGGVAAQAVTLGVRPEDLAVVPASEGVFAGEVTLVERLGSEAMVYLRCAGGESLVARLAGDVGLHARDTVALAPRPERCHLFDAAGRAIGVPT